MRTRQMLRLARATLWVLLMGVDSTTGACSCPADRTGTPYPLGIVP